MSNVVPRCPTSPSRGAILTERSGAELTRLALGCDSHGPKDRRSAAVFRWCDTAKGAMTHQYALDVNGIDLGEALDVAARTLAAIVSAIGIIVAVGQWTRSATLKRRQQWLRETTAETNKTRKAALRSMLDATSAQLVAGIMVPSWRFLILAAVMLLGPVQAYAWAQDNPSAWGVVIAVLFSLAVSANPIRQGVRLLAERYRVAHEYMEAKAEIRTVRLGILNQMEGGTRLEMAFGFLAALAINLAAAGIALAVLEQVPLGLALSGAGLLGTVVVAYLINRYARSRVAIYGPWSVDDPRL